MRRVAVEDAVVGDVADVVFEGYRHRGHGPEDDLPSSTVKQWLFEKTSVEGFSQIVLVVRIDRFDEIAYRVDRLVGVGVHTAVAVCRRRRRRRTPGQEIHAVPQGVRVARGIGAAQVERAENSPFRKSLSRV